MRKVRNRLLNISTRCKGLVTDDGPASDLPWTEFEDRTVYVIDIANVDPLGQDLVFARVVSKLREQLERRELGVDAVVVFVDELNKYAPGDGPETYVKKMLLDISERGRYLGLVLFGAEQFRSQVHRRVVGNAGTQLFGRMDMDELATPGYQILTPADRKSTRLNSSHGYISYAVFCLKKKKKHYRPSMRIIRHYSRKGQYRTIAFQSIRIPYAPNTQSCVHMCQHVSRTTQSHHRR